MKFDAHTLWLIHHASLGGVSGATGAKLPATLDEVQFPAVRMSHWGMALVLARHTGKEDPPLPTGMTEEERDTVLRRLDDQGLLPWRALG
jgi:hypothetical protein